MINKAKNVLPLISMNLPGCFLLHDCMYAENIFIFIFIFSRLFLASFSSSLWWKIRIEREEEKRVKQFFFWRIQMNRIKVSSIFSVSKSERKFLYTLKYDSVVQYLYVHALFLFLYVYFFKFVKEAAAVASSTYKY